MKRFVPTLRILPMNRRHLRTALYAAIVTASLTGGLGAQAAPPSAEAYYATALERMKALPEPAGATYDAHIQTSGSRFLLTTDGKGRAQVALVVGSGAGVARGSWRIAQRPDDANTSIQLENGKHGLTDVPLFNATWNGAYDFMRYGFEGRESSHGGASFDTVPSASPHVIAIVKAIGTGYYRVSDDGSGTCANGDPAHSLRLTARNDPERHPLTNATIDTKTGLICTLRFAFRSTGGLSASGYTELHFSQFGPYQMISDEKLDINVRLIGIAAHRLGMTVAYDAIEFPSVLPDALFSPEPSN